MEIDLDAFILKPDFFNIQSFLHGIHHTYRVMNHCLMLGNRLKSERETRLALCAAFIHDMARKHDGRCEMHGKWAGEEKLPLFRDLFYSIGVLPDEIHEIKVAVANHSVPRDLDRDDPCFLTASILKDADALDRIRLGEGNLDISMLRFEESFELIEPARTLYLRTDGNADLDFRKLIEISILHF